MSNNNNNGFFLGALFGAAIGGVAALLYAPKSGRELREDLMEEADYLLDRASDYADYAQDRGSEFYDAAQDAGQDIKVNLQASASNLKDSFDRFS